MTAPANLREQLARDEALRFAPYMDCCGKAWRECECAKKGKLTIGYGRNLDDKGISQNEAGVLLDDDVADVTSEIGERWPWALALDEARRGVLCNMAFNIGLGGLGEFHRMLAAAESGDYDRAAAEMMDSAWAAQVGPRAHRLARQMQTGEWQ